MSPVLINTLLEVYAMVTPTLNAEGIRQALQYGLIMGPPPIHHGDRTFDPGVYTLCERGEVAVEMLSTTPLPVPAPAWKDPRHD